MQLKQTTAPINDPISLSKVKEFLHILDDDSEDVTLNGLIQASINTCERHLQRSLITQTWTMYVDCYSKEIELPRNPVQSITSITSYASDNTTVVNPDTAYFLVDTNQQALAVLQAEASWDNSTLRPRNGVEVIYVAGYGDDPEDVPFDIRQGLLAMVAYLYEHREEPGEGVPAHIKLLWEPYMVWYI